MDKKALKIVKILKNAGFKSVFAGGCVRDMLLGRPANDIDIATDATPEQIEALFEKTIPVGKAFGVIIVVIDDIEYEVATFRNDGVYSDNRRPDSVSFSTMKEDAKRRDLTINGMFYDPIEDKVLDFVEGKKDLKNGIIRLIGNPEERIHEDKLRMMRVVRFAIKFGFEIESKTLEVVKKYAKDILLISKERIATELIKILKVEDKSSALELLSSTGLMKYILPEIEDMKGVEQPPQFHPEGSVWNHTKMVVNNLPKDASDELLMAGLLHDVGKPPRFKIGLDRIRFDGHDVKGKEMTEEILKRFKFSNDFVERVTELVGNHMKWLAVKDMRKSRLKRFIRLPFFEEHKFLHRADCLGCHGSLENLEFIEEKEKEIPEEQIRPEPLITGKDLIEIGFKPGPLFKTILTTVEDKQLEEDDFTREKALKFVREVEWEHA